METINDLFQTIKSWPYKLPDIGRFIPASTQVNGLAHPQSLKIGIIDTGVNRSHPCFTNSRLITKDFSGGSNPVDEMGHGSHCSALLVGNETEHHIGLVPRAQLYAAKIIGRHRIGPKHTEKAMIEALRWLSKNQVRIILITMGRTKRSIPIENQINLSLSNGVVIIASAGNHGGSLPLFPASMPKVICVSALGKNGLPLPECYTGDLVDVFSPGEAIISVGRYSKYCEMSGSSQAAAIFCGLLAREIALKSHVKP